jgi:hypothetical protein
MIKAFLLFLFLSYSTIDFGYKGAGDNLFLLTQDKSKDNIERQILYNGRVWQNQFSNTEGNQFFVSSEFSNGGVVVDGHNFDSVQIKYDLINDELLIQRNDGTIILINKEMINSFNLFYYDRTYRFVNFDNASAGNLNGYCHLLYDGDIKIYVKYTKELIPTTITNGLPRFSQVNKVYVLKDGKIHRTDNRKELLNLFAEGEEQIMIKKYIRSNQIMISRNDPESYRRVIEYYETKTK